MTELLESGFLKLMSAPQKIPLKEFAEQCRDQAIPLSSLFSYFCVSRIEGDVLNRLLHEPVAAIPPELGKLYKCIRVILVPYLGNLPLEKKLNGLTSSRAGIASKITPQRIVSFTPPPESPRIIADTLRCENEAFIFLAVTDEDSADLHYGFYGSVAHLICESLDEDRVAEFTELLRKELTDRVHGEIDECSWNLKEDLLRRQSNPTRNTKLLRGYLRQSMQDTLTLYMHGLCCDIDLETGPRQLNSRDIRRRLNLLRQIFPPPPGFALFPEELDRRH